MNNIENNEIEDEEESFLDIVELMTFKLGNTKYAINLLKIKEILAYPDNITKIPNTQEWVKGLVNSRGEVVPVLDIRIKFEIGEIIYNKDTSLIIVRTDDKRILAIVVDELEDVKKIKRRNIIKASKISAGIPSRFIEGYIALDEHEMLVILDIEKIVSKEELF